MALRMVPARVRTEKGAAVEEVEDGLFGRFEMVR